MSTTNQCLFFLKFYVQLIFSICNFWYKNSGMRPGHYLLRTNGTHVDLFQQLENFMFNFFSVVITFGINIIGFDTDTNHGIKIPIPPLNIHDQFESKSSIMDIR